jgi:hypothetical protein
MTYLPQRRHALRVASAPSLSLEPKLLLAAPSALDNNGKFRGLATQSTATVAKNAGRDQGLTPASTRVTSTIQAGTKQDYTSVINAALKRGGVVQLGAGTFPISNTLKIGSNATLRGAGQDKTTLVYQRNASLAVHLSGDNGGMESLGITSTDYLNGARTKTDRFGNSRPNNSGLGIGISGNQNLVNDVRVRGMGGHALFVEGHQNTIAQSTFEESLNRGGGNGYVNIQGDRNLLANNRILNVRHLGIQKGAQGNVVAGNTLNTDINFHDGDDGRNLISGNELNTPTDNTFGGFATGAPNEHRAPGSGNILINNTGSNARSSKRSPTFNPRIPYTVQGFEIVHGRDIGTDSLKAYPEVRNDPVVTIGESRSNR